MKAKTVADIRKLWIEFFEEKGHLQMPSAALLPAGDPTLLFTTAGMVQFKPFFAGTAEPPRRRVVTIQKCMRTTDLESVGKTARHCTFFEMLGNFSFGDYFKKEAIEFAWEFSTKVLGFPEDKIYVTVFESDDEAENIWLNDVGVPKKRITRLGKKDNWWGPAGDSGACGPCSELYLDRGKEYCHGNHVNEECGPGAECDRFMEFWNLVFNQYNQDTEGKLHPLPQTGIDTGSGLERVAALINGKDSVYDTDELFRLIQATEKLTEELSSEKKKIKYTPDNTVPFRVLADHARSVSFAIADGIHPDNTGRGYVVRRIIRRSLLFVRDLNIFQPILHRLAEVVIDTYQNFYPELKKNKKKIIDVILSEEKRFLQTLEFGLTRLEDYLAEHERKKAKIFSGEDAFRLYDTFGFPLEMTIELAERRGLQVDMPAFESSMAKQKEQAGRFFQDDIKIQLDSIQDVKQATFIGYDQVSTKSKILAIIENGKRVAASQSECLLIVENTPFYPEGGGQIGDLGTIKTTNATLQVKDTKKKFDQIIHVCQIVNGEIREGDLADLEIDLSRRQSLTHHHSATHLLNKGLRSVLGDHILQTGSLVAPDYLRFDFSHNQRLSDEELLKVEQSVNEAIKKHASVTANVMPIQEAKTTGAVATFGEKYGDVVRIISMGEKGDLSIEFCGGCHVSNTGDIGAFHITKEGSPGAGNRRIEAVAGGAVAKHFISEFESIAYKAEELKQSLIANGGKIQKEIVIPVAETVEGNLAKDPLYTLELGKLEKSLAKQMKQWEEEIRNLSKAKEKEKSTQLLSGVEDLLKNMQKFGKVEVLRKEFEGEDANSLRKLGDAIKEKVRSVVLLFGGRTSKGPLLVFMANKDALAQGVDCKELIQECAPIIGGSGGGRSDMAQAGGSDSDKIKEALDRAEEILKGKIK